MVLIKIGHFEVNPDAINFIYKDDENGYDIVFQNGSTVSVENDSDAYIDLSMFITTARYYYGNGNANEESEKPESNKDNQTTNESV